MQHTCLVCDYVYDDHIGDITQGIAPGTKFESLPHDWACPICGIDVSMFDMEVAAMVENRSM